jgi:hypothetical protein
MHLEHTNSLLSRITDATGPQFLAEWHRVTSTAVDPTRPEYLVTVRFWKPSDRDLGLDLLLTAVTSDGFAVASQSSNLLDLCEVELTLIQNEMEEVSLSQCARLYSRDGYLIAGDIEVVDRTEDDGGKWFRVNCTLHEASDCELIEDGQGWQLTLPCGEYLVW